MSLFQMTNPWLPNMVQDGGVYQNGWKNPTTGEWSLENPFSGGYQDVDLSGVQSTGGPLSLDELRALLSDGGYRTQYQVPGTNTGYIIHSFNPDSHESIYYPTLGQTLSGLSGIYGATYVPDWSGALSAADNGGFLSDYGWMLPLAIAGGGALAGLGEAGSLASADSMAGLIPSSELGAYGAAAAGTGATAAGTTSLYPSTQFGTEIGQLGSGTYLPNNIGQVGTSLLDATPATINQMVGQASGALDAAGALTTAGIPGINQIYDFSTGTYVPAVSDAAGNLVNAASLSSGTSNQLTDFLKSLSSNKDLIKSGISLLGGSSPTTYGGSQGGIGMNNSGGVAPGSIPQAGLLNIQRPHYQNLFNVPQRTGANYG